MGEKTKKPHKVFFETLANTTRWEIVHALQNHSMKAGDIAEAVDAEQSLISHHLKRLRECGFVEVENQGRERIYTLNNDTIEPLIALMDEHIDTYCENCSFCNEFSRSNDKGSAEK